MASDETPVERRLRDMVNWTDLDERHAIACGSEAIRLVRAMLASLVKPVDADGLCVYHAEEVDLCDACEYASAVRFDAVAKEMRALLARCTEGPR